MSFEGYDEEALGFLSALPDRTPEWFKQNRADYERLIVAPTKDLVVELGAGLAEHRPRIVAEPRTNGSIAPINNDLRFSPGRARYKDHLLLRFWEGMPKKHAPTLFVRISPDGVGFASGIVPGDVATWRRVIDSPAGERIAAEIERLGRARSAEVAGQELKRVPAPYVDDHPRADLLRHKMVQLRWIEPTPAVIDRPAFVAWCQRRLESCLSLHGALVDGFG